jgi:hypothetical protein
MCVGSYQDCGELSENFPKKGNYEIDHMMMGICHFVSLTGTNKFLFTVHKDPQGYLRKRDTLCWVIFILFPLIVLLKKGRKIITMEVENVQKCFYPPLVHRSYEADKSE